MYILPDGIYTVVANFDDNPDLKQPGNISAGVAGNYLHPIWPRYAWFVRMENGVYNGAGLYPERYYDRDEYR